MSEVYYTSCSYDEYGELLYNYEHSVLYIYYDVETKQFRDCDFGNIIYNIFDILTPNDIYLFRMDPGNNIFYSHSMPGVLVEIVSSEDDNAPYFDPGDDYERITRYEKERHYWEVEQ